MEIDLKLFEWIEKERQRQQNGLELIASENYVSDQVLSATGSILTNKYAEGYPGKRYYGGCEFIDPIEEMAINRLKEIFGVAYANVQPHSGSQANAAVFSAILQPGDKILGFNLSHGGHLTHGSLVNFSGKLYNSVFYGVEKESGLLDYDRIMKIALRERPKVIIAGATAYSRDINYKRFREIADTVSALLIADIAHPAGLIAGGLLSNPVPHCHIITSTTHKTMRGPRGGIIMMGSDFENPFGLTNAKGDLRMMSSLLDSGVFPGNQGGPLMHIIAAKAAAFGEMLTDQYQSYIEKVQINARIMSEELVSLGYEIVSGGTDNHLMLLDLSNKSISGKEAEVVLGKAAITVNKNMVPFDWRAPQITSGIRIGTAAITTRGLLPEDMREVANLINQAFISSDSNTMLNSIARKVEIMMRDRPMFLWDHTNT